MNDISLLIMCEYAAKKNALQLARKLYSMCGYNSVYVKECLKSAKISSRNIVKLKRGITND